MPYRQVKMKISPEMQKKVLKGAKIRVPQDCIGTGQIVVLHPLNYKKVVNSKGGINLELSPGEVLQTAAFHGMIPKVNAEASGSGIFDDIWSGLKTAGKWLKDTGIASSVADIAQEAATPFVGPGIAGAARRVLKDTTGVGLKKKTTRKKKMPVGEGLYI